MKRSFSKNRYFPRHITAGNHADIENKNTEPKNGIVKNEVLGEFSGFLDEISNCQCINPKIVGNRDQHQ